MAERFKELSDNEIQVLRDESVSKCTKWAIKFGMKVFNGTII